MRRRHHVEGESPVRGGFRYRGREVSRIEAFSDAVFGFAITLLVVSLEVPRTFGDLMATVRGFGAFALSFAMLFMLWFMQNDFFRRYGLGDAVTVWLNAALMFLVMFFVYPLKFLFTLLVDMATGMPLVTRRPDGTEVPMILAREMPQLMTVYGLALMAVFLLFALLHGHASRRRRELDLDAFEAYEAATLVYSYCLGAAVPLASIVIANVGGPAACLWAGMIYCLIGPLMGGTAALRNGLRASRSLVGEAGDGPDVGDAIASPLATDRDGATAGDDV